MNVIDVYHKKCREKSYAIDQAQEVVAHQLDNILVHITKKVSAWHRIKQYFKHPAPIKGLYLYGSVGSGKTFIMDCFYEAIPFQHKLRMHFHEFMHLIHAKLKSYHQIKNPLDFVAKELSKQYKIICFDEFYVNDIVDAMLLGGLLKALYSQGVMLVATSNAAPDDLYPNGLQRELFKKTIQSIKQHNECLSLKTDRDYRLTHFKTEGVFFSAQEPHTLHFLESIFYPFCKDSVVSEEDIESYGRRIAVIKHSQKAIWFDFAILCRAPRSQEDYLFLAKKYQLIILQNIRPISSFEKDRIVLFIKLIDVLYDKRIALVCSLSCSIDEIYQDGPYLADFNRAKSRLIEMQSFHYFEQCTTHKDLSSS